MKPEKNLTTYEEENFDNISIIHNMTSPIEKADYNVEHASSISNPAADKIPTTSIKLSLPTISLLSNLQPNSNNRIRINLNNTNNFKQQQEQQQEILKLQQQLHHQQQEFLQQQIRQEQFHQQYLQQQEELLAHVNQLQNSRMYVPQTRLQQQQEQYVMQNHQLMQQPQISNRISHQPWSQFLHQQAQNTQQDNTKNNDQTHLLLNQQIPHNMREIVQKVQLAEREIFKMQQTLNQQIATTNFTSRIEFGSEKLPLVAHSSTPDLHNVKKLHEKESENPTFVNHTRSSEVISVNSTDAMKNIDYNKAANNILNGNYSDGIDNDNNVQNNDSAQNNDEENDQLKINNVQNNDDENDQLEIDSVQNNYDENDQIEIDNVQNNDDEHDQLEIDNVQNNDDDNVQHNDDENDQHEIYSEEQVAGEPFNLVTKNYVDICDKNTNSDYIASEWEVSNCVVKKLSSSFKSQSTQRIYKPNYSPITPTTGVIVVHQKL